MHHRELIEVAGVLAFHGRGLIESPVRFNDQMLSEYWAASRCRLDRWGLALRNCRSSANNLLGSPGCRLLPLAEEIVTGEILTRLLTALFIAHDEQRQTTEAAPIGRNIFAGHREALDRLFSVAGNTWGIDSASATRLRSLSERCQRWTDMLLAYMWPLADLSELAFDVTRVKDFAQDIAEQRAHVDAAAGRLLEVSLQAAFGDIITETANEDLHARIAGAAIGCLGPEAFDSFGLLRSTWIDRIERTTDETSALLENLFSADRSPEISEVFRWRD